MVIIILIDCSETLTCFDHADCAPGQQCVVGWCGDPQYLSSLSRGLHCSTHHLCQDLLLGHSCCLDVAGVVDIILHQGHFSGGWNKLCCDNEAAPVTLPPANLSSHVVQKVHPRIHLQKYFIQHFQFDRAIQEYFSPVGLDILICEGITRSLATQLKSCKDLLVETTTTTSTSTTSTTSTESPKIIISSSSAKEMNGIDLLSISIFVSIAFTFWTMNNLFLMFESNLNTAAARSGYVDL